MREEINIDGRVLVVFDGHCGLCNRTVRWLLMRDRHDRLRFVPSQSPLVAGLLARHGMSAADSSAGPASVLAVRDAGQSEESMFVRSRAVLELLRELPRPWPAVAALLRIVPTPVLDLAYRRIARWRYRIWGRVETCPIPTQEERKRFLDHPQARTEHPC